MSNIICFVMVAIAYALGHVGGYRLCKFRIKNKVLRNIRQLKGIPERWQPPLPTYEELLYSIGEL